jgi:hypothetical protein
MTAALFQANHSGIQIYLIMDNQDLGGLNPVVIGDGPERASTVIHVGGRFEKQAINPWGLDPGEVAGQFFLRGKADPVLISKPVNKPEPGVVTRRRIISARITQACNEFQPGWFAHPEWR